MGFGVNVGRVSDTRLLGVYCSNTAGSALNKGWLVALRHTSTTLPVTPEEKGQRFGAAVDHAAGTNSLVVGIMWTDKYGDTTVPNATWGKAVTRGPLATVYASGTITAGDMVWAGHVDGAVYGSVTVLRPYSFVGYPLGAVADNSTGTIACFVNTLFA